MSDFFLAKNGNEYILKYVRDFQHKRGFSRENLFQISCGNLLLFPKKLVDVKNYYIGKHISVFCVGTVIYKGLSFSDSLAAISDDFDNNCFDFELLRGEFVLIVDDGKETTVVRDNTGMYKLFSDQSDRFLTTSFLSAASCTKCTLNEIAVAEQFIYGFISAPDTLVNEISCVSVGRYEEKKDWFNWLERKGLDEIQCSENLHSSVIRQRDELTKYLRDVTPLVKQYKCECGLSGGCDSRLIYYSVNSISGRMTSIHTHKTSEGHNKEIKVVKNIAKTYDTPVVVVPTVHLMDCSGEEIDQNLREIVLFFDGRNAETIGSCNQTYTMWYREKTANGNGVTFSGIGGEIYRDFYYTRLKTFRIKDWLKLRVFQKHIEKVIPRETYNETVDHIINKIKFFTGLSEKSKGSIIFSKRYFDQYRIPNALGNVVHANNQMNFFLAPFTDAKIIARAKPDNVYQDHCGEYEGRIMKEFHADAPDIMSSKGYAFSKIPFSIKVSWKLRSMLPLLAWKIRDVILEKPNERFKNEVNDKFSQSRYITDAMDYFTTCFPNWNMEPLRKGEIYINPFVFAVCAIYEIHKCSLKEG